MKASNELQRRRINEGTSVLTAGFKAAGIVPLNASITLPKTRYAQAVYQHTPEQVAAAMEIGKRAGQLETAEIMTYLADVLAGNMTGATTILLPHAEAGILERQKLGRPKGSGG